MHHRCSAFRPISIGDVRMKFSGKTPIKAGDVLTSWYAQSMSKVGGSYGRNSVRRRITVTAMHFNLNDITIADSAQVRSALPMKIAIDIVEEAMKVLSRG